VGGVGIGCFQPTVNNKHLVACETLGTFVFMLCVFATVWYTQSKHGYGTIGPIMIGLSLLAPALALAPLTGGAMNPARVLASHTVFKDGECDCGSHIGSYIGGEMFGATLALVCIFFSFGVAEHSWYSHRLRSMLHNLLNNTRQKPFVSNSVVNCRKVGDNV
jgi:glycerol uptake facilitator-like aquaporin